jgi:hypothetical protein
MSLGIRLKRMEDRVETDLDLVALKNWFATFSTEELLCFLALAGDDEMRTELPDGVTFAGARARVETLIEDAPEDLRQQLTAVTMTTPTGERQGRAGHIDPWTGPER